jgi:TfoX/Sxy family transcriptional regulator of competence genes
MMAYDEKLAARIGALLKGRTGITHKKMFGGIAFLVDTKMFVGVFKDELMARVGKERHADFVKRPGARTMDFGSRPMIGYIYVKTVALKEAKALRFWVETCLEFARTLEKKPARKKASKKKA